MQTSHRNNLSSSLGYHYFNYADKEASLPHKVKIKYSVASQNPLLTQRANPTVSFVDVIVWLGRKHRCDKGADSNIRGEKNSTSAVGHSVVTQADHMGCFRSAPAISQHH